MSASWWKRLWLFLYNFFVAAAEAVATKQAEIKADQDKGASDQREADRKEDEKLAQEAGELKDEIDKGDDADARERLSRWLRPPR